MYQKEIIDMGLFHDDVKEKNAGYLKVDKRESVYRLELQVKNISGAITGNFPIRLQSETGWQEADALNVKDGNGKWNGSIKEPVWRVEVLLTNDKKIKGESRLAKAGESEEEKPQIRAERKEEPVEKQQLKAALEEAMAGKPQPKAEWEAPLAGRPQPKTEWEVPLTGRPQPKTEREVPLGGNRQSEAERKEEERQEKVQESVMRAESMNSGGQWNDSPVRPIIKAERISVKPEHTPLYENKWEQLLTTYEQIHPYGDNRIYVKLAPKDFIILRENYQHLVNNSFLLHGFYNYRYLILGKEKDFYLGVPGVFYEREKMVALMFGFEAFECEGGKAEEGKFGYYLRKVEL